MRAESGRSGAGGTDNRSVGGTAGVNSPKRYSSVEEEAQRLGICLRTFRGLIRRGVIPSYRIGRRRILLVAEEIDRVLEDKFLRGSPQPA